MNFVKTLLNYIKVLLFIVSILSCFQGFSQSVLPYVEIEDHNNNTGKINIDCDYKFNPGKSILLTADYPMIRQTDSYTVSSVDYSPFPIKDPSEVVVAIEKPDGKSDDIFSAAIELPFKFCFYGNKYSQIVISDNGVVSFNVNKYAQKECSYSIKNQVAAGGLIENAIFGVYHDMQNENKVRYYVTGTAPYRKFIINYDGISQYGYGEPGKKSTSQIVLHETTNIIDVFVKDRYENKTTNSSIDPPRKNAVIGLTNFDSTIGIAAKDRDTGNWEAHNEGWRFLPSGKSNITVYWYNGFDSYIGSGDSILVFPSEDTKYKVKVFYNLCSPLTVEDEIQVIFSNDFPTATLVTTEYFCVREGETQSIDLTSYESQITTEPSVTITYHKKSDVSDPPLSKGESKDYKFSDNTTVYVKVWKEGICYAITQINIKVNKTPKLTNNSIIKFCGLLNKTTVNLLTEIAAQIPGFNSSVMEIKFYKTPQDVDSGESEIVNRENYPLEKYNETLYFRVWNSDKNNPGLNDPGCYTIYSVNLVLNEGLEVNPRLEKLLCYVEVKQDIIIDLTQFEEEYFIRKPKEQLSIKYYGKKISGKYEIDPQAAELKLNATVYVEITSKEGCTAELELILNADSNCDEVGDKEEVVIVGPQGNGGPLGGGGPICDAKDGVSIIVDLTRDYLRFFLPKGLTLDDIEVLGFYSDKYLKNSLPNPLEIIPPMDPITVYAQYKIKAQKMTVVAYFPVVAMKEIDLSSIFEICNDDDSVQSANADFSIIEKVFREAYPKYEFTTLYFSTWQGLENYLKDRTDKTGIVNFVEVKRGETVPVYVLFETYGCEFLYEFAFTFGAKQIEELPLKTLCDFGADGVEVINLTDYEQEVKDIFSVIDPKAKIIYFINDEEIENPESFVLNLKELNTDVVTVEVWIKVENQCTKFAKFDIKFTTTVNLPDVQDLYVCDDENDNEETVNLSRAVSNLDVNSIVNFYTDKNGAETGGHNGYWIGTYDTDIPVEYLVYRPLNNSIPLFVRVEDKNSGCFKVLPFTVFLVHLKDVENKIIKTCDFLNDDKEEVTVEIIKAELIKNNSAILDEKVMSFQFYDNEQDAENDQNEITSQYQIQTGKTIWVRVAVTQGGCFRLFELDFQLIKSSELVKLPTIYLCNNNTANSNGQVSEKVFLDDYKNDILGFHATTEYRFTYYSTENTAIKGTTEGKLPGTYIITGFPITIFVRVDYVPTGCFSVVPLTFDQHPSLDGLIKDAEIIECAVGEFSKEIDLREYPLTMIQAPAIIDDFEIKYYTSKTAAANNGIQIPESDLPNYVVTSESEIWIKFISKSSGCFVLKKLGVIIYGTPKAQDIYPTICDENDGNLDGTYIISDLDIYKNQIITGEPNIEKLFIFTYYYTYEEAMKGFGTPINKNNFTFLESDITSSYYKIYARIDKTDGTGCFAAVAISFYIYNKVPVSTDQPEILECDSSDDDGKAFFDLSAAAKQISSTAIGFKYYPTEQDARANTNEIPNFTRWQNVTPYEHIVYVRVMQVDHCENISSIKLKVYPYINAKNYSITICEFNAIGKPNTINLKEEVKNMTKDINTSLHPNLHDEIETSYYNTETDALSETNKVPYVQHLVYEPPVGNSTIWVRFQSKNSKCYEIRELEINKIKAPELNKVEEIVCDDNFDDEYDILLSSLDIKVPVIAGGQKITYHGSPTQAWENKGFIDKDVPFIVLVSQFPKTIAVRVVDINTGCVNVEEILLKTNPKAPLNTKEEFILQCDEPDDDGFAEFDLTRVVKNISSTANQYVYYPTLEDAQKDINKITHPKNWKIATAYDHTVYVRIRETGFCDNLAFIKLKVYPYIKVVDHAIEICEFTSDIVDKTINLEVEAQAMIKADVQKHPELKNLEIKYYTSENGAITKNHAEEITGKTEYLPSVNISYVWVRFQGKDSNGKLVECFEVKKLTINKLEAPKLTPVSYTICDENLDGEFYIIPKELESSGFVNNPGNYIIAYYPSLEQAKESNGQQALNLDNKFIINKFTTPIYVRVTNNKGCANVVTITIKTNPVIEVKDVELTACDGDNNGNTSFDLTLVEKDITQDNNSKFTYYKTLKDVHNDNPITDLHNYINSKKHEDIVYVKVEENVVKGEKCPALARIKLKTYYPNNPLDPEVYICPRTDVILDGGDYDEWKWGTTDGIISGDPTQRYITIGDVGTYSVTVTQYLNYGLTCSETFSVKVKILQDPVIINLEQGKDYVTVVVRGPQPLEYSMDNETWQPYSTFSNLEPGIYTFHVRSKANGCSAVATKTILFGIPNVITPNGDGYNDVWRMCGLEFFEGKTSTVKILDRYGKVIFQEETTTCFIWDGHYLGRRLPTGSYWYIIEIPDGRKFTGWIVLRNYS